MYDKIYEAAFNDELEKIASIKPVLRKVGKGAIMGYAKAVRKVIKPVLKAELAVGKGVKKLVKRFKK